MRSLVDLVQFQKEEIQALIHEGRQGELEQANLGLADENEKLRAELAAARDALTYWREGDVGSVHAAKAIKRIDESGLLKK